MIASHDSYVQDHFEEVKDAFNDCDLNAILGKVDADNYDMSRALYGAAEQAAEEGHEHLSRALRLLADACSFVLSPDKPNDPFGPLWVGTVTRSAIPADFTKSEVGFIACAVEAVDDHLLKARLADVVWSSNKSFGVKYAWAAIDSYMALPLKADAWFKEQDRCWQRAIGLARMLGTGAGDRIDRIETKLMQALDSATPEDGFFSLGIAHALMESGLGVSRSAALGAKLESLAHGFDVDGNFHASTSFYDASSDWYRRSGDLDKSTDMTIAQAEALVKDADARVSAPQASYSAAATFLETAVQVYRSIPRAYRDSHQVDQRVDELRSLINEYGALALDEMGTFSGPELDLGGYIQQARDAVSGLPIDEALNVFANLHHTRAKQLRQAAIDSLARSPLRAHIPKVISSHDGRRIARTRGISGSTPTQGDDAEIRAEMIGMHYLPLLDVTVNAAILPALEVLVLEHRLQTADLIDLARRSPIVPTGRERLFGKALAFGFNGDFATSLHLLAPQIEHMVRVHLNLAGVNTTRLDQDGLVSENGLSALVDLPEMDTIFGDDWTFEIRTLFCDQLGPNLRNNIAHGLLDDQACLSSYTAYGWWFAFKLVFMPFWNSLAVGPSGENQGQTDEAVENVANP